MLEEYDYLYKLVMVGDSGVGKSNILLRQTKDEFNLESRTTIGVEFATFIVSNKEIGNKKLKFQLWDTAGQERYRAITAAYYRGAVGVILVYDITKKTSFENIPKWLEEINKHTSDPIIYLVGNKQDLKHSRAIPVEEARKYADDHNMKFIETSALDGRGVREIFTDLASQLYKISLSKNDNKSDIINKPNNIRLEHTSDVVETKSCC